MSGILRRTALLSHHKDGVYNTGWRRVVTGIGWMLEPGSFADRAPSSTNAYDMEWGDMISHIDDIEWVRFGDRNQLSGTESAVKGSENGWTQAGQSVYHEQV